MRFIRAWRDTIIVSVAGCAVVIGSVLLWGWHL